MAKNKKFVYILIPCTLLLWGMIIYKIYKTVKGNSELSAVTFSQSPNENSVSVSLDTFSIHKDYRDPFLPEKEIKERPTGGNTGIPKPSPTAARATKLPEPQGFPSIVYSGIIKNNKAHKELILVQINGKSYTTKVGEILDGVQITKVFRDSIEVQFNKTRRFISK